MNESSHPEPRRKYIWPWIVIAAVLLAVILAVIWMTVAVQRLRNSKTPDSPSPALILFNYRGFR